MSVIYVLNNLRLRITLGCCPASISTIKNVSMCGLPKWKGVVQCVGAVFVHDWTSDIVNYILKIKKDESSFKIQICK